jgi:hypothetical protein
LSRLVLVLFFFLGGGGGGHEGEGCKREQHE